MFTSLPSLSVSWTCCPGEAVIEVDLPACWTAVVVSATSCIPSFGGTIIITYNDRAPEDSENAFVLNVLLQVIVGLPAEEYGSDTKIRIGKVTQSVEGITPTGLEPIGVLITRVWVKTPNSLGR